MALRHKTLPVAGLRFRPESIVSSDGLQLLRTFLRPDYPYLFLS